MRKKLLLILLFFVTFISFTSAGTHYVVGSPLGIRFQNEQQPSYQLGIQEFSFLWNDNVSSRLGMSRQVQQVYQPRQYIPVERFSKSSINGNMNNSLHSMGLHFSLDYIDLAYYDYLYGGYERVNQSCFQMYGGVVFRQYIINGSLFLYEATGASLGSANLGVYGDIGLMYEAPFGLVANVGMRIELGGTWAGGTSSGFAFSFGMYAGAGYSF